VAGGDGLLEELVADPQGLGKVAGYPNWLLMG
jgi:hypothetical protein